MEPKLSVNKHLFHNLFLNHGSSHFDFLHYLFHGNASSQDFPSVVALYCTYCTYARTVLPYRIDLSYTYCTYIPYSFSPSRILNPDTVYVDASQLQATSFTFLANVVSFAFSSLLTYLVTNISSFSALQPLARPSPHYICIVQIVPTQDNNADIGTKRLELPLFQKLSSQLVDRTLRNNC